jgi:hypothetical protein
MLHQGSIHYPVGKLVICSYICLALKGTHLMKVLLLVFELYNKEKSQKT